MIRLVLSFCLFASCAAAVAQKRPPIRLPLRVDEKAGPARPEPPKSDVSVPADTNPDPKSLEYGEAELNKARALAKQLGSRDYQEREAASRALAKIGRAGILAIREVRAADSNPEVRLRTDILLPRAESDDMKARVLCFLADKDGKFDHKLPGWERFKTLAGTDKPARELFAEVLKRGENHALLLASEMSANDLAGVLSRHYETAMMRQQNGQQPTAAETAVLAFLECQHSDKDLKMMSPMWGQLSAANFLYHQDVQNAMRNGSGKYGEPLRRIVTKWLESRETAFGMQTAMNLAQNWQLKDQLRYAARMFQTDDPNYQWAKAHAAQQIATKHNAKGGQEEAEKYLPLMAKALDADTLLTNVAVVGGKNPNEVVGVNTQDYVLGLLCRITKQKPADYGLTVQPNGGDNFQNYGNWYFQETDKEKAEEKRAAGIKKFKAWAEKNIMPEPPKKEEPNKKDEPKKDAPAPPVAPVPPPIIKK